MNTPNRASDAGPDSRNDCLTCGSKKWHTLGDCEQCGDRICSECPGSIESTKGLYCAKCVKDILENLPVEDWPPLMPLEQIAACVRYANVPEWLKGGNGLVN